MAQILGLIFRDKDLCRLLAFKGGTALMFFHNLPRFSTDLDFNLLDPTKEREVFAKVRGILQRFGTIDRLSSIMAFCLCSIMGKANVC